MKVERASMIDGVTRTMDLDITEQQLADYEAGKGLIQTIFPDLTPDEREFIKTGITPDQWNKLFDEE